MSFRSTVSVLKSPSVRVRVSDDVICGRAIIAEKLIEYMSFKAHYETVGPKEDIPSHEFMERLPREIVLEL